MAPWGGYYLLAYSSEEGRRWRKRDKKRSTRREDKEREKEKERERGSVLRSVARGEDEGDSLRSENSLVTMNGPNESREPIKDYSRRCSANGIKR